MMSRERKLSGIPIPYSGTGGKEVFLVPVLAIGPAVDNGFYYDFDVEKPFSTEDCRSLKKK